LVTDWDNFLSAKISQKTVNGSLKDNFILLLVYTKYDKPGQFRRTIDLTNTQDKGEEEVIATIRYFYTLSNALETKTE